MKIFFDTIVILDLILERESVNETRMILQFARKDAYSKVYCSSLSIADTAYVIRRFPNETIKNLIGDILKIFDILPVGDMELIDAGKCFSEDYEDSIQIACAEHEACDLILTRNKAHFASFTEIPVLTPEEFVSGCVRQ